VKTEYHSNASNKPVNSSHLKATLAWARNGKPVFPCRPGGKEPLTKRGHLDATTDPRKIHMWWNRYPGANIGIPTGKRSGIFVVDHDIYKEATASLEEVEAILGPVSKGVTIATGSGGRQYVFRYPEGSNIRNATDVLPGVDIRGEGGYILAPGSTTKGAYRRLDKRPLPEPPAQLVGTLTEPQRDTVKVRSLTTTPSVGADGPPILQGSRDDTLARIAGRMHDGTRSPDDLSAELLEINARRCEPPLPDQQVVKVARSIHRREPCRPGRPKEVDELVGVLSDYWHGQTWKRQAKKSEARFARALIREGRKFGKRVPAGLRVEKSFRQMAEILGVHRNTVSNLVSRAKETGWLRQDNADRRGEKPGAFVLVDPRRFCDTDTQGAGVGEGVTSFSRPPKKLLNVADLTTPHHRHRGLVGYSKEHTLCVFEARGPLDRETASELLGWARPRDLERLHLEPLSELGLLEKRGDIYAVSGDYRQRQESVLEQEYSTLQPRVRRERSVEGRNLYVVRDSGIVASEAERLRLAVEQHARERDGYRNRTANPADSHYVNVGADGYIEDLERLGELSEADSRTLEAIEAFEDKFGRGSFRWDRVSCKALFYSSPEGIWPEPEELRRIQDYLAATRGGGSMIAQGSAEVVGAEPWDAEWAAEEKAAEALRYLGRNCPECLENLRVLDEHETAAHEAAMRGDREGYLEALRAYMKAGRDEALRLRRGAA
jgi:bifunctional DNA primase/polymerase-like protein/primase-like protein